jgi:hypothetical protein
VAQFTKIIPIFQQCNILIIPSVLLFLDSNYTKTVNEIYEDINAFQHVFSELRILPFPHTEQFMESKEHYMSHLIGSNDIIHQILTSAVQQVNAAQQQMLEKLKSIVKIDSLNGFFPPTILITSVPMFHEMCSRNNETIHHTLKFLIQLMENQMETEKWKSATNENGERIFIMKCTNGTRADAVEEFIISDYNEQLNSLLFLNNSTQTEGNQANIF